MITVNQLATIAERDQQTPKLLEGYLHSLNVAYEIEHSENDLFRVSNCPLKGRDCGDRSYIIVFPDGGIHAGCHGAKCEGKGWDDFQAAWGTTFDAWLKSNGQSKPKKTKAEPVAAIVAHAEQQDTFFHDADGVAYVLTIRRKYPEVLPVRSQPYANVLRLRYTDAKKGVAKREWIKTAIEQIEAIAIENGSQHQTAIRVAHHAGKCYVDLADTERTIIEVDADGWRIVGEAPVFFRRPKSMRALPFPERGGKLEMLQRLVNISPDDFPLYAAMLVMVFHPQGPFPIAALIGGPGHAKSSTVRDTRVFVDPSNVTGGAQSKNSEDLLIAARDRRLVTFDNLDHISQQQSDDLCRLATGASFSRRTLYSDSDETTFTAKNPVIITSIKDVLSAADLLDRSIRFVLPKLEHVVDEIVHDAEVEAAAPQVLGLILDGVSSAMRNLPTTVIDDPPRMAGFALWGTAAEEGLRLPKGSVMEAYRRNIGDVDQLMLESDLAQSIVAIADKGFRGKTKELAQLIGWGTSAQDCKELVGQLRQLSSILAKQGIVVDPDRMVNGHKIINIYRTIGDGVKSPR